MIKNNIIVINPTSVNTMKAICNAIISNIVNIIIFGDKEKIKVLCNKLNISIGILRIIQCSTEKEIVFKIQKYQEQVTIKGIIIDEIKDNKIKEQLKCIPLCHIIDFGVFRKSVFILNYHNKDNIINSLNDIFTLMNKLNIKEINIGLISCNKEKAIERRKHLKEVLQINTVDIIDFERIKKGYYNIIIFETKQLKQTYINQINELVLPRIIEINKASNTIVLDAKGKKFKNIFFEFVLLSKLELLNDKIYSQTV